MVADKALDILKPVFERHDVPESARFLLYRFTEILIEEDLDNKTIAGTLAHGNLPWSLYDELLQSCVHPQSEAGMGHRSLRTWLTEKHDTVTLTRKGRALINDLGRALPDVDAIEMADSMFGDATAGAA